MLFYQSLDRLEFMHKMNYIHRDLKPENILMGLGKKSNLVHLIDFGLARPVVDPQTGKHIPFCLGKNLLGTCRYVSINAHLGYELSRRDDLMTLGYVLLNFYLGSLPWSTIQVTKDSARYRKLGKAKLKYTMTTLFDKCPPLFKNYMDYCKALAFEAMPDFKMLKAMVVATAEEH